MQIVWNINITFWKTIFGLHLRLYKAFVTWPGSRIRNPFLQVHENTHTCLVPHLPLRYGFILDYICFQKAKEKRDFLPYRKRYVFSLKPILITRYRGYLTTLIITRGYVRHIGKTRYLLQRYIRDNSDHTSFRCQFILIFIFDPISWVQPNVNKNVSIQTVYEQPESLGRIQILCITDWDYLLYISLNSGNGMKNVKFWNLYIVWIRGTFQLRSPGMKSWRLNSPAINKICELPFYN